MQLQPEYMDPIIKKEQHLLLACTHVLRRKLPELRRAIDANDQPAVVTAAQDLRGAINLLGLKNLFRLSQEIEYQAETLPATDWDDRCRQFCDQLERCFYSLERIVAIN